MCYAGVFLTITCEAVFPYLKIFLSSWVKYDCSQQLGPYRSPDELPALQGFGKAH